MRCRAIVDLGALIHNYGRLREGTGNQAVLLCVVKADAYGHGAVPVARALMGAGARHFAVATLEEAVELRDGGVTGSVVVLGGVERGSESEASAQRIEPLIGSISQLRDWDGEARRAGRKLPCHLLLNTGMNRLGIDFNVSNGSGGGDLLDALAACDGIELRGVATHYASSEDFSSGQAECQADQFGRQLAELRSAGVAPRFVHSDNSAALVYRGMTTDCSHGAAGMVRPGLALYGYVKPPVGRAGLSGRALRPVLEWRAQLLALRDVQAGAPVGYGATFVAPRPTRVGVLSVGYGDGLDWRLSNRGAVSIDGSRCPIVGEISMDLTIVDVTAAPRAKVGDEALLLGKEPYDAQRMAGLTGGISYEVLCRISKRVPRQYVSGPSDR